MEKDAFTWSFDYEIIAAEGDLGVLRGTTLYAGDKDYSNLWLITLNDSGECTEFIEYWMERD